MPLHRIARLQNVFLVSLCILCVHSQTPVFLVDPVSIAAIHGTTAEFSCTAENAEIIIYIVNGSSAAAQDVQDKGFVQLAEEQLGGTIRRRNLTVTVSSQYNNTEIFCRAIGTDDIVNSETVMLTVQGGPLSSVGDLSSSFIDSSTVNISWSPPFTLPGTAITGYNISVTSNGTTTNYFTSDSYYVLQLSDITDYPCDRINIGVSGYNGLNGETEFISVPFSNPVVPISVVVSENLQVTVRMNVTNICIDEIPTTVNTALIRDEIEVHSMDVMLSDNTSTELQYFTITYTVMEDTVYTAKVSFSIFDGGFDVISRHVFKTFGVRSVNLTDTAIDTVFCTCILSLFSTDTGCTVQLLLSEVVQYENNFTRSGNTASGNIFGVATGLYLVHVFDQDNPAVALASELMVIGEPCNTTTTSHPIRFLVHPISVAAMEGTMVEFSCTVQYADQIDFRVNCKSADTEEVRSKGFYPLPAEELGDMRYRRNLTVSVSSLNKNSEIFCRAGGSSGNVNSKVANLTLQDIIVTREASTTTTTPSVTSLTHTSAITTTTSSPSATPSPGDAQISASPAATPSATPPGDAQTTTSSTIAVTIGAVIIVLLAVV